MKLLFKLTLLTFLFLSYNYSFSQEERKDSIKMKALLDFQKKADAIFNLKNKKLPNFNLETINGKVISSNSLNNII